MSFVILLSFPLGSAFPQSNDAIGFNTPAPHVIIMDYESGIVLFEKDARDPVAPASMTKIMTAELVFERLRNGGLTLDTEFLVSENAWRKGGADSGGSTMFLALGSTVRIEDLLRGVIVQSGNDACIVLAEGIAGSEVAFAEMMTAHAQDIGLESASFRNATGLDQPGHEISLYDLAKLSRRTISEFSEFYPMYSEKSFEWNGIKQGNRNPLLGRFDGADGLKTGFTKESGYGLVASAQRGDQRRIVVFNGLNSKTERRNEGMRLMQAAFDNFKAYQLYEAGQSVTKASIYMGQAKEVELVVNQDIVVGLAKLVRPRMTVTVNTQTEYAAPIMEGDQLGELVITAPDLPTTTIPLYAAETVKRKSAFGRALSSLVGLIRG
ncbi:MAG: D-alanyl-D-alanine carboxypeptidase [Hellea sp.]|nr:D-alanyl-D-alanine carboxypeptidase [Hellea sp.]